MTQARRLTPQDFGAGDFSDRDANEASSASALEDAIGVVEDRERQIRNIRQRLVDMLEMAECVAESPDDMRDNPHMQIGWYRQSAKGTRNTLNRMLADDSLWAET